MTVFISTRPINDGWKIKKWSERILGIERHLKAEYDTVDTQVVDTTLQIFPMYSVASFFKMAVTTCVFVLSVYTKDGSIFNMFDDGLFRRGEDGEFTEAGWMDILVCIHLISGISTFYFSRIAVRVKLQKACFSVPLLMTIPIATLLQLLLEMDGVGMWYPTVPDRETTVLLLISLTCGFVSMAILTEHIWHDNSTTYALDRYTAWLITQHSISRLTTSCSNYCSEKQQKSRHSKN